MSLKRRDRHARSQAFDLVQSKIQAFQNPYSNMDIDLESQDNTSKNSANNAPPMWRDAISVEQDQV
jgi:hypothetical protein